MEGLGKFGLTYEGSAEGEGNIYGYFALSMIDNLGLELGLRYQLEGDDKVQEGIAVGLTVQYDVNDQFGLKLRAQGRFGGDQVQIGAPWSEDFEAKGTYFEADILPYYAINGNFTAFFSAGLAMTVPDEGDNVVGWHINPYIVVGNQFSGAFYLGFRVASDGEENTKGDKVITWGIPVGISYSW